MTEPDRRQAKHSVSAVPGESMSPPQGLLRRGDLLGRYQLLCAMARGGMGEVWAARETGRLGLPRLVAIKIPLLDQQASRGEFEQSLFDEARVAASIDHPNVCKILELGRARGYLFLAMEWIHGVSLSVLRAALAPTHRMDFGMAAFITAQACGGLHAAHELKDEDGVSLDVVHRDATPHNLLIGANGDVKVVDFGIAKARNQRRQVTEAGAIKGKLSYLAPEQLAGKTVDRRTDIYMLGCVLYLITTGHLAFDSRDAARTLMQISQGDYTPASSLVANYPARLEAIVNRAMAIDPDKRFRTADEMRIALETFVSEQPRPATREDLSALVTHHCGKMIEERRSEVRIAQKTFDAEINGSPSEERLGDAGSPPRPRPKAPPFPVSTRKDSGVGAVEVSAAPVAAAPERNVPPKPLPPRAPDAANVLARVPGTLGCSVGDRNGFALGQHGQMKNSQQALVVSLPIAEQFGLVGTLFGFGGLSLVTTKSSSSTLVTVYQANHTLAVEVDSSRPLTNIEFALKSTDFAGENEWVLSDKEIEYVEPDEPPKPLRPEPKPRTVPREGAHANHPANSKAGGAGPAPSLNQDWAEVRRTLIKGQLSSAQRAVMRIQRTLAKSDQSHDSIDSAQLLQPLLEAIANILAGDNQAGLKKLELVVENARISASFKWAAQVWSARASANTGDGLEAARVYAESSLRLAERLDDEALAVSTLLVAEIMNYAGERKRALELTATARALFTSLGDKQELAACWLLEARVLAGLDREQDSIRAAQRAQESRPSWPPPVTLLVKQALAGGRVPDADQALQALLARRPIPAEAERDRRLIEHVRAGIVPAAAACTYLDLLEARVDGENIRRLESLSSKYPRVAQFLETLGWKLLRAGKAEPAKAVFERLSARGDLPDDLRASVLLGLGCLATNESGDERPSAKLRAAVNAAPKHSTKLKAATPAKPPSIRPRPPEPADFRLSHSVPPKGSEPASLNEATAQRKGLGGPVFSGSLELFSLPDLLEFMRAGRRTGTLICSSVAGIGAVHLHAGNVTGAAAPETRELVEYLVLRKAVTREQLASVQPPHGGSNPEAMIGRELVRRGLITLDQLRQALRDQIMAALADLARWGEGQFAFNSESGERPEATELDIEFDAQALLLEMYKEMDERATNAR
ncbi:MAG TPA: DUF4388 domain-containing protein [Polyangiaceae bacterium]|nr:DUF4388 domain-containing protein [Polyangiaceae bacterium]